LERRNGRAFRQFFMVGVAVRRSSFRWASDGSMEDHAGGIRLATAAMGFWGATPCCY